MLPLANEGRLRGLKLSALGRNELWWMKSLKPFLPAASPAPPAAPVVASSRGLRGRSTFHIEEPSNPVWVPMPSLSKFHLWAAVGDLNGWIPDLSGLLSTSRGFSMLRRSNTENWPELLLPAE